MKMNSLLVALSLSVVLLAGHLLALYEHWYWVYDWFDIPMHILGGATLGALLIAFLGTRLLPLYIIGMLVVVVGWEVFEYIFGISTGQVDYWSDTIQDMCNGLIGGAITYLSSRSSLCRCD